MAENQTAVTTVTATDVDIGQTLTYSITGGADSAKFNIGSSSGLLTFQTAPDFESPTDVGGNNVYDVLVTVTDNGTPNLTDVQDIAVTVTNVVETLTIGNGTAEPTTQNLDPGATAALDTFSLATSYGTAGVTAVVVNLSNGTALSAISINSTLACDGTSYGSLGSPANGDNTVNISTISASTGGTGNIYVCATGGTVGAATPVSGTLSSATATGYSITDNDTTSATLTVQPSTVTIGNGTAEPTSQTLNPGATLALDAFTLHSNTGTATVTAVAVNLVNGSALSAIAIRSSSTCSGGTTYGTLASPVSGSNSVSLTTNYSATTSTGSTDLYVCATGGTIASSVAVTGNLSSATTSGYTSVDADATSATLTVAASEITIGNGSGEPSTQNLNQGATAALDAFTLQTNFGSASVASLTVNLTNGTALASIFVNSAAGCGGTTYGTLASPVDGDNAVSLGTTIGATTSSGATNLYVCATGGSVVSATGVTGTISAATATNFGYLDSDSSSATLWVQPTTTTVGDATEPGNTTVGPGGAITALDAFTLQTSAGTDSVASVTVTLAIGTSAGLAAISIWSASSCAGPALQYGSAAVAGDSPIITLSGVSASTTPTTYYVCVTPRAHADMLAPPGASYSVTGTLTEISAGNPAAYADATSATVTVDNLSPGNASWGTVSPGNNQISLGWSNPGDADFSQVVILRNTAAITDVPVEGASYSQLNTVGAGNSLVVYVGSATSYVDNSTNTPGNGPVNGTAYYYKVFAKDSRGNYALGAPTGSHTPQSNTLTVGDGTNPGDASRAPGDAVAAVDTFTLQTSAGTDTVTAATVSLAAGSAAALARVGIWSGAGCTGTEHGFVANPALDTVAISLGTSISATTTLTSYYVCVTSKAHADMPAPPGASYTVTGTVTALTSSFSPSYGDSGSSAVTIDNLSPGNASWGTVSPGNNQISLGWSNPGDADFAQVVILRNTAAITDVPLEGASYSQLNTVGAGSSLVVYVGSATSYVDNSTNTPGNGPVNETAYYYKVFAKDSRGNYALGAPTGPHNPSGPVEVTIRATCKEPSPAVNTWTTFTGSELGDLSDATLASSATGGQNLHACFSEDAAYNCHPISQVSLHIKARTATNDSIQIGLWDGTSDYLAAQVLTTTLTEYTYNYASPPWGGSWTYSLVDSLVGAVLSVKAGGQDTVYLSEMWAVVTYNPTTNTCGNTPPVATNDSYAVSEGGTRVTTAGVDGVKDNDTDAEDGIPGGNVTQVSGPAHATVFTLNANGSFNYTHDGSETVSDSFGYTVQDSGGLTSNTATVTITITAVNDPPAIATNVQLPVDEGSLASITTAYLNEGDPDDAAAGLTYTVTSGPSAGSIEVNGVPSSTFTQDDLDLGLVDYVHDGSEGLSDSFGFLLADGGEDGAAPATGTFVIVVTPINDAPSISTTAPTTASTGVPYSYDANVSDPDDSTFVWTVLGDDSCGAIIVEATGVYTFTPVAGGTCQLSVQVCDGSPGLCDTETATINIISGPQPAGSTDAEAPAALILNPMDGQTVSVDGAGTLLVQVKVLDVNDLTGLSVVLWVDGSANAATFAASPNYSPTANVRVYEATVSGLGTGPRQLQVQVTDATSKSAFSAPVELTINPVNTGDGMLLVRDNASQLCEDCHTDTHSHNSMASGATSGSWAVGCRDCHTMHGTHNLALIKEQIKVPSFVTSGPPTTAGVFDVKFYKKTGVGTGVGADFSFANTDPTTHGNGPCQVCHTRTSVFNRNTEPEAHYGSDCKSCHKKDEAFKPSGCNGCHGNSVAGNFWPDGTAEHGNLYPNRPGRHDVHVARVAQVVNSTETPSVDQKNATCGFCHNDVNGAGGGGHNDAEPAEVGSFNPIWSEAGSDDGSYVSASKTCSSVDCHNNKLTTAGSLGWSDASTSSCAMCHVDVTSTDPTHVAHLGASTTYGFDAVCADCHDDATVWGATAPTTGHWNGQWTTDFAYAGVWATGFKGNCGTNVCHSDGKNGAPKGAYTWGTPIADPNCGLCHDASPPTGSHGAHLASTTYGPHPSGSTDCGECHAANANNTSMAGVGTHLDVDVTFSDAAVLGSTTACNVCHGGATPATTAKGNWATAIRVSCESCHGDATLAVISAATAPERAGADYDSWGHGKVTGSGQLCVNCHDENSTHISGSLGDTNRLEVVNGRTYNPAGEGNGGFCASACHTTLMATVHFDNTKTGGGTSADANACMICHDPHGQAGLDAMIATTVNATTVAATTNDTSVRGFYSTASYTGICQVCHDPAEVPHFNTSTNETTHNATGNCLACHKHDSDVAFKASGCNGCHGGGNNAVADANYWPDSESGNVEDDAGEHLRHLEVLAARVYGESIAVLKTDTTATSDEKQKKLCAYCHADPFASTFTPGGAGTAWDDVHNKGTVNVGGVYGHRIWDTYAAPFAATDGWVHSAGSCSSVDCHHNQTTPATQEWYDGAATSCAMCHVDVTTSDATHLAHTGAASTYGATITCNSCHVDGVVWGTTAPATGHIEGSWTIDQSYTGVSITKAPGTCGTNACHENGLGGAPARNTYTWGTALADDCASCHLGDGMASNKHNQHLASNALPGATSINECYACHSTTATSGGLASGAQHLNGSTQLALASAYNYEASTAGRAGGTGATTTCSNVICHNGVTTPTWNGTVNCGSCHNTGGTGPLPSATSVAGSHATPEHANNDATYSDCANCHTGSATYTPTGGAGHQDLIVDVSYYVADTDGRGGVNYVNGTENPDIDDSTCASVSCHGDGTPTWGGTTTCSSCHSASNALLASHQKHYQTATDATAISATFGSTASAYVYGCGYCHPSNQHADGNVSASQAADVAFSGTLPSGTSISGSFAAGALLGTDRSFEYTSSTCSALYCHSNAAPLGGTNSPKSVAWGSTLGCNGCHNTQARSDTAVATDLSNAHGKHLKSTSGEAGSYSYQCKECHNSVVNTATDPWNLTDTDLSNESNHVRGEHTLAFSSSFAGSINQATGTYNGTLYTCASTYCHSQGTSTTSFVAPNANAAWNATASCETCHSGNAVATNKITTGAHDPHTNQAAVLGTNLACYRCHEDTVSSASDTALNATTGIANHVDGQRDVNPSDDTTTVWNGTTCATSYCHSNGTETPDYVAAINWASGALANDCKGCHGAEGGSVAGEPRYANNTGSYDTRNSHAKHVGAASDCVSCHAGTVTSAAALITSGALHLDKSVQVSGAEIGSYTDATETCNNVSCHGGNSPQWGGPSLTCSSCHGGASDSNNWTIADGTASVINTGTEWTTYGHGSASVGFGGANVCLYCHDDNAAHNTGTNPFRLRGVSVSGGTTGAFNAATENGNGACFNCHRTGSFGVDPDGASAGYTLKTSTKKIDAWHYGASDHTALKDGGSRCWDCHDPHGDGVNIKMIGADLVKDSSDAYSLVATRVSGVVFTANTTGTDYAGASATKVCNACHSTAAHYAGATGDGHQSAVKCVGCHIHDQPALTDAFKESTVCNACHNSPPTLGKHAQHDGVGTASSYTATTNYASAAAYGYTCGQCHTAVLSNHLDDLGGTAADPYVVDVDFAWDATTYTAGGTTANETHATSGLVFKSSNGSCGTSYCHDPQAATYGSTAVTWTTAGPLPCTACHDDGYNQASTVLPNAHSTHTTTAAGSYNFGCEKCHADTTTTGNTITNKVQHADNSKDVKFNTSPLDQSAGTFTGGAAGTCANTYCHSNGQDRTAPFTSGPSLAWNASSAADCSSCHGGNATAATKMGPSNDHAAHMDQAAYLGTNTPCGDCHNATVASTNDRAITTLASHVNGAADVNMLHGGTYGGPATKTCTSVYCHSDGTETPTYFNTNLDWDGGFAKTNDCKQCHGTEGGSVAGEPRYANNTGSYDTRNSHAAHVGAATDCVDCHAGTVQASGALIAGGALHLDQTVQVSGTVIGSYSDATETCNTVTCHGGGSPQWGGTVGCRDCHMPVAAAGDQEVDDYVYSNGTTAKIDRDDWYAYGHGATAAFAESGNAAANFDNGNPGTRNGCLYCHTTAVAHGVSSNPFKLANVGAGSTVAEKNGVCTICHGGAGYNGGGAAIDAPDDIDAWHYGAAHSTTGDGGQYCWDCHDPHGDYNYASTQRLAYMIEETPTQDHAGSTGWGIPTTLAPTPDFRFNRDGTGSQGVFAWGDYVSNTLVSSTYRGVCQVCHSSTNVSWFRQTLYTAGHNNTGNPRCSAACHTHDQPSADAFKPAGGDCKGCHGARTGSIPRAQIVGGTAGSEGDDFIRASRHVSNGTTTSIVTNFDCIVCHTEGDVTSTSTDYKTVAANHGGDSGTTTVDLRNVDSSGGTGIMVAWPGKRLAGWTATTANRNSLDSFCMGCHDANGASNVAVNASNTGLDTSTTGAAARRLTPFNTVDTRANARDTAAINALRTRVTDIKSLFNSGNLTGKNFASHHNLNQFTKRYTTVNANWPATAWTAYVTKEGQTLNAAGVRETAGLHCSDCHLNEANAHGTRSTWYMLASASFSDDTADVKFTGTGLPGGTDNCFRCHNSNAYGQGGTISGSASRTDAHAGDCPRVEGVDVQGNSGAYLGKDNGGGSEHQIPCLMCHAGGGLGWIHGMNFTYKPWKGTIDSKTYRFQGGGGTWRWYSPLNRAPANTTEAETMWEGGSGQTFGCYTLSAADAYGACAQHGTGGKNGATNYARPLQY